MAILLDLTHARRARRLFSLLVERHGIHHFLQGGAEAAFRLDPARLDQAVALCGAWLERRTGRPVNQEMTAWLRRDLRRTLIQRLAECMVQAGY
jgi:hypothetical protein